MKHEPLKSLQRGFDITETEAADGWVIKCKRCARGWALGATSDGAIHPGNILHLLNHEAGHKAKR